MPSLLIFVLLSFCQGGSAQSGGRGLTPLEANGPSSSSSSSSSSATGAVMDDNAAKLWRSIDDTDTNTYPTPAGIILSVVACK